MLPETAESQQSEFSFSYSFSSFAKCRNIATGTNVGGEYAKRDKKKKNMKFLFFSQDFAVFYQEISLF